MVLVVEPASTTRAMSNYSTYAAGSNVGVEAVVALLEHSWGSLHSQLGRVRTAKERQR